MCDLEHIDDGRARACLDQLRVDLLLGVTREQESTRPGADVEDDRDVVDPGALIGRLDGHLAATRPEDAYRRRIERESVARGEKDRPRTGACELPLVRLVPGCSAAHARLGHLTDAVARQEEREPARVVLVRMGQHDKVQAPVPRRDALVQKAYQPVRIRAGVDEHP